MHESVIIGLADNVSRAAEALFKAKAECKLQRIGFYSWIKSTCRIPLGTAQKYMQMANSAKGRQDTSKCVDSTLSTSEQSFTNQKTQVHSTTALVRAMCDEIDGIAVRVDSIEAKQAENDRRSDVATAYLKSLPGPKVEAPMKSPCDLTEQRVRFWCVQEKTTDYRDAWVRLYEEFRRRCGIDARARHRNDKKKYPRTLDVVRGLKPEEQEQFYAIACDLFPLSPHAQAI